MGGDSVAGTLPTGTVTFLFTDIEGSTRLWEKYPEEARRAFIRHDALVEGAVRDNGGQVVRPRGEGDSRFAVFARASDAVASAAALQRALYAEEWPTPAPLRVRMALHTGEADLREGDYYGNAVNRCARLRSAAYGGQTLISQATGALVASQLPEGVKLLDLGEHSLKDLAQPEHIFQLVIAGLPSDFPPINTLDARPNNLPTQRTLLIGRDKELADIVALVSRPDVGLLTLTGPAGTGKTRLSLQAAAEMLESFEDGVFFVNLGVITDASLVLSAIAQASGVREVATQSLLESVKDYLRGKHLLLLLDNFEHVLPAANLVSDLISSAPRLKVMVTSRETLRLYEEHDYPVPPLESPDPRHLPSIEDLMGYEAVRLFIERARLVRPGFALARDNAEAVVEICSRLDGLPLAIELAAARVAILPPAAILSRLKNRLKLLTGGARDLPARQQTLKGAIDWSYGLLTDDEQKLFRRLSVFVGGCTLEGIEAVCKASGDLSLDVLDLVSSLITKSLLMQVDVKASAFGFEQGEPRFGMLETIREYAMEKLAENGEVDALRKLHAEYIAAFVADIAPRIPSRERKHWLARISYEQDNIRAALDWLLAGGTPEGELALATTGWLGLSWDYQSLFAEGRHWVTSAIQRGRALGLDRTAAFARALSTAGLLAFLQGDAGAAQDLLEESIQLWRDLGDRHELAWALWPMGMSSWMKGDYDASRAQLEESVELFRQVGNNWGLGMVLFNLGDTVLELGDEDRARSLYAESVHLYDLMGDRLGYTTPIVSLGHIAWLKGDCQAARSIIEEALAIRREEGMSYLTAIAIATLSEVARCEGKYDEAASLARDSLAMYKDLGERSGTSWALHCLGYALYYQGDYAGAEEPLKESLKMRRDQANEPWMVVCLASLASLAAKVGRNERAAILFGGVDARIDILTRRLPPSDHADYDNCRAIARQALGDALWSEASSQGQAASLEQLVADALSDQPGVKARAG